jgi:hypothetical protein
MADGTESEDRNPYAALFDRHRDWIEPADPRRPFPMFGFECGLGWASLIGRLFDDVAAIVRPAGGRVEINQIKEKFGSLRFYYTPFVGQDECRRIEAAVDLAAYRSEVTCEECGRRGSMRDRGHWYSVRCNDHAEPGSRDIGGPIVRLSGRYGDGKCEFWRDVYDPYTDSVTRTPLTEEEFNAARKRDDS